MRAGSASAAEAAVEAADARTKLQAEFELADSHVQELAARHETTKLDLAAATVAWNKAVEKKDASKTATKAKEVAVLTQRSKSELTELVKLESQRREVAASLSTDAAVEAATAAAEVAVEDAEEAAVQEKPKKKPAKKGHGHGRKKVAAGADLTEQLQLALNNPDVSEESKNSLRNILTQELEKAGVSTSGGALSEPSNIVTTVEPTRTTTKGGKTQTRSVDVWGETLVIGAGPMERGKDKNGNALKPDSVHRYRLAALSIGFLKKLPAFYDLAENKTKDANATARKLRLAKYTANYVLLIAAMQNGLQVCATDFAEVASRAEPNSIEQRRALMAAQMCHTSSWADSADMLTARILTLARFQETYDIGQRSVRDNFSEALIVFAGDETDTGRVLGACLAERKDNKVCSDMIDPKLQTWLYATLAPGEKYDQIKGLIGAGFDAEHKWAESQEEELKSISTFAKMLNGKLNDAGLRAPLSDQDIDDLTSPGMLNAYILSMLAFLDYRYNTVFNGANFGKLLEFGMLRDEIKTALGAYTKEEAAASQSLFAEAQRKNDEAEDASKKKREATSTGVGATSSADAQSKLEKDRKEWADKNLKQIISTNIISAGSSGLAKPRGKTILRS